MTYHDWSDESFDWKALDGACDVVYFWATRVGRLGGQIKEKYGTLRFYAKFYHAWWPVHELCKPGHVGYRWNRKLMLLEIKVLRPVVLWLRLYKPIQWYQSKLYRFAYKQAIKKYPHIKAEILDSADYPELLEGL